MANAPQEVKQRQDRANQSTANMMSQMLGAIVTDVTNLQGKEQHQEASFLETVVTNLKESESILDAADADARSDADMMIKMFIEAENDCPGMGEEAIETMDPDDIKDVDKTLDELHKKRDEAEAKFGKDSSEYRLLDVMICKIESALKVGDEPKENAQERAEERQQQKQEQQQEQDQRDSFALGRKGANVSGDSDANYSGRATMGEQHAGQAKTKNKQDMEENKQDANDGIGEDLDNTNDPNGPTGPRPGG